MGSSSSSCLSWHGILLAIQLIVSSMLTLFNSYIWVVDLVCAHLMRTRLLAESILGRGPRPAGCQGLVSKVAPWPGLPGGPHLYLHATVGTHEGICPINRTHEGICSIHKTHEGICPRRLCHSLLVSRSHPLVGSSLFRNQGS